MFLPLHDEEPMRRLVSPLVTWGIIGITTLIFALFQSGYLLQLEPGFSLGLGLVPSVLFGIDDLDRSIAHVPAMLTPVTHLFLHGGFLHLAGNMLFLWVFGDNVEDEMGHGRFAVFYCLVGAIAGIAYALSARTAQDPLIGASGAVSGVLGAYLVLRPKVRVFGLFLNIIPLRIPAFWFIGGWFLFQLGHAVYDQDRSVAWVAHVAGVVAGAALVLVFRTGAQAVHPLATRRLRRG